MITLTQSQVNLLEALDLYWRVYDRGPDDDDLRFLSDAPDFAMREQIYDLRHAGLIKRWGKLYFCTDAGREVLRHIGRYPFDPDPIRSRFCSHEQTTARSGGVELRGHASSAAGTSEARP